MIVMSLVLRMKKGQRRDDHKQRLFSAAVQCQGHARGMLVAGGMIWGRCEESGLVAVTCIDLHGAMRAASDSDRCRYSGTAR